MTLARFDRKRKKPSNKDWTHPHDPDAKRLRAMCEKHGIKSIAVPALGCENGRLRWESVLHHYKAILETYSAYVELYEPAEAGERMERRTSNRRVERERRGREKQEQRTPEDRSGIE